MVLERRKGVGRKKTEKEKKKNGKKIGVHAGAILGSAF